MGANVNTHEFIEKSVREELQKLKFSEGVCFTVAQEAVDYYRQRSTFSKNVVLDVLTWSKKRAKSKS